ncbi:CLUMA_CG021492, isoform A [Clunio marinus]|uniref:CLUMA_CG021492, isoform A n=1 Tax=Clunio marinus TaxID=568069 RepID=A0A1J1J927_9DIPT|nr:CLUMA_CG021492, isoform A [Clunio marinus]
MFYSCKSAKTAQSQLTYAYTHCHNFLSTPLRSLNLFCDCEFMNTLAKFYIPLRHQTLLNGESVSHDIYYQDQLTMLQVVNDDSSIKSSASGDDA